MSYHNPMANQASVPAGCGPLTDDQLRALAPSVFAEHKSPEASSRFSMVSTVDVVNALRGAGFLPVSARQATTQDETRRGFVKHIIRFRHERATAKAIGDVVPEVVLVNAHDRTSAYKLLAGLFRLVCLNGLVVGDGFLQSVRVAHVGDVSKRVLEGSAAVMDGAVKSLAVAQDWGGIGMGAEDRLQFADEALALRYAEDASPIDARQLLRPRRNADDKQDLWTTFNVVQENLMRGKLRGVHVDAETGRRRNVRTRPVGRISEDVRINKALWELAERYAAHAA